MKNKDYIVNYNRTKTKLITLRLSLEHDSDIVEYLDHQDNVNGFLKDLIRDYLTRVYGSHFLDCLSSDPYFMSEP